MKQYIKNNQIKTRQEIVIVKNGMRTINPTEEQILADGWVEYVAPVKETVVDTKEEEYTPLSTTTTLSVPSEVADKAAFVRARHKLRNAINRYDSSSNVNSFYMQGQQMWLDKATRAGLMLRFQAEQAMGNEYTTLWYGTNQFEIPLMEAFQMLYALEVYASQCYDNTQRHLADIAKLETIEEIESHDYTTGYPEILRFNC